MIDFYLKFADEAEAQSVLYQDDQPLYANIDTLGIIYTADPVDPEAPPIPEQGWHVNVRVIEEDPAPLEPFQVFPITPRRVWA